MALSASSRRTRGGARSDQESRAEQRLARKHRRQEGRRAALLVAARSVLVERGLDAFTVGAVAEAADLSKASLFYYFDSKEAIVAALAAQGFEAERDAMLRAVEEAETGRQALAALVRAYVDFHREDLAGFRVLQEWTRRAGVQRRLLEDAVIPGALRINDVLEAKLKKDRRAGELHPDAHPRRLANVAFLCAHGLISAMAGMEGMGGGTRFSLDQLCEEACSALVRSATP